MSKKQKIIDTYNKGISNKFLQNSLYGLIAIIVTIIMYERDNISLFEVIAIAILVGLLMVLILTPIQWLLLKRKYNKIMRDQEQ